MRILLTVNYFVTLVAAVLVEGCDDVTEVTELLDWFNAEI